MEPESKMLANYREKEVKYVVSLVKGLNFVCVFCRSGFGLLRFLRFLVFYPSNPSVPSLLYENLLE